LRPCRRSTPLPGGPLDWNVRVLTERDDGLPVGRGAAADAELAHVSPAEANYYLLLDAGAEPWPTLVSDADAAVNDRMERFLVLEPVTQTDEQGGRATIGPLVQTVLHKTVGGNAKAENTRPDGTVVRCDDVVEKVKLIAVDDNATEFVKSMGDVCPPPQ
jgi:hypothetical protein